MVYYSVERYKEESAMQVIVFKSPKCLAGLLRAIFKIKKTPQ
ncbi:MAG: stage V sporulation protein SpoVM [Oscillospiraceae bacterium]|nr:stage V sporulation protein SpoVM [Oscillospiraceae bacterium]